MTKVFISYSRKDKALAGKLTSSLEQNGLETWIDWEDIPPTSDWMDQIHKGIEDADGFLFLLSPDSLKSVVCSSEIDHAVQNGKRLIPLVVREVDPKEVHPALAKVNWIYCREQDDFEAGVEKLLLAVRTDLAWVEAHRQLQVKALEWRRGSDASLLLRGLELRTAEQAMASAGQKDPQPTDLQRQFVLASRTNETRRRGVITAIAVVVMIALAIASLVAINQRDIASQQAQTAVAEANARGTAQAQTEVQRRIAVSRQLAAQAGSSLLEQPDLALLLSYESYRSADTFESRDMLLKSILHEPRLSADLDLGSAPLQAAFSPDGKYLAAGLSDGSIVLWLTGSWERKLLLPSGPDPLAHLFFDRAGRELLAVHCTLPEDSYYAVQNCHFTVWDLETQTSKTLSIEGEAYLPAALSPAGRWLVFRTSSGFRLWDVPADKPYGPPVIVEAVGGDPVAFAFSPDGAWLLAGSCRFSTDTGCFEGGIDGWNISDLTPETQPAVYELGSQGNAVVSLAFDSSGLYLASGSCIHLDYLLGNCPGGEVRLWTLTQGLEGAPVLSPVGTPEFTQSGPVSSLALSYQDEGLLAASGSDNRVYLYKPTNLMMPDSPWSGTSFIASSANIAGLALDPAGRWLAAAGGSRLSLWEIEPAPLLQQRIETQNFAATSLVITSDDQLISLDAYGGVSKYDLKSGRSEVIPLPEGVFGVAAITPDGRLLAFAEHDYDAPAALLDLTTGQPVSPLLDGFPDAGTVAGMPFGDAAISPDQRYYAASGYSQVVLWDLKSAGTADVLTSTPLEGGSGGMSLAFSHAGRYLAAGGETGGVTVWDLADRSVAARFSSGADIPFTALAFTPDDRLLAAAVCIRHELTDEGGDLCRESEIRLWDLETGQSFGEPLPTFADFVLAIGFDASGERLFVFPFNDIVYEVWNFKLSDWVRFACDAAGRNFTRAEWAQYFPGEEYRLSCQQWPLEKNSTPTP